MRSITHKSEEELAKEQHLCRHFLEPGSIYFINDHDQTVTCPKCGKTVSLPVFHLIQMKAQIIREANSSAGIDFPRFYYSGSTYTIYDVL